MVLAEVFGWDMVIIAAVIALLFGGSKLPKLARSLGSAKGEFERGLKEGTPDTPASSEGTRAVGAADPGGAAEAGAVATSVATAADAADVERRLAEAEARRLAAEAELARLRAEGARRDLDG